MDTMYSRKTSHSKKKKIHTVYIGKSVISCIGFLVATIITGMIFCLISEIPGDVGSYIRREFALNSIPIASASAKRDFSQPYKKISDFAIGTSFGGAKQNFRAIPLFYEINNYEKNIVTSGKDYVSHLVEENTVKAPEENISEQQNTAKGLTLKNETTYTIDTTALMNTECDIKLNHKEPEILIVHTHGSESYTPSEKYSYTGSDYGRCQDTQFNVVRVGQELKSELTRRGFNVIHDTTINDYPSYNKSYTKTLGVIEEYLSKYPSIKCVFDVHRDAITDKNDNKIKFTADIKGEKVSQIMIVCGSDQLGLENPDWQKNLSTALKIQNTLNTKYPGLMRPLNLRKERFNLHKTTGSFIFEFGTHGNTLDEVLASVKYFADGIEDVLK